MSKYKTYGHAKTHLRYHVIFSTKYRRKVLVGLEDEIIDVFRDVEARSDFRIHAIGVDKDHVHLVVSFRPSLSISQVVRRIKQMSTRLMWERYGRRLRKTYYGKMIGRLWTGGYFCETVGPVAEDKILEYVKSQGDSR